MRLNLIFDYHKITIRYGVVANISRSHNLRDQFRGAQGSIPCTGECLHFLLISAFVQWNILGRNDCEAVGLLKLAGYADDAVLW
jgi:hypothetical protein